MIRLTEIEQRARAATPGPWAPGKGHNWAWEVRDIDRNGIAWCGMFPTYKAHANAAHIAGMSPDVVLQMVAALRAAKLAMTGANKLHWDALRAALSEIEE